MKIPSNKQWTQDNSGDTRGTLGSTTNMSMDMSGKAMLSRKAVNILGTRDDSDFGFPLAITYFDNQYVCLTDDKLFTFNFPSYTIEQLTWPPAVGLNSDAVVFNNLYTITTDTSVYTWNGGTLSGDWVNRSVALTSSVPHPIDVFGKKLAIGNGNKVELINTAYVTTITLTLPTEHQVTTIRAVNNYIYIGTKNLNGGNARVYVWNGDSEDFDYECEVGASWVFSMTPYLSSVVAVTSQGQLGYVSGTTFQELAGLPVYYQPHSRWQGSGGLTLNGKVFNRGMVTVGDTVYMNIEGDVDSEFMPDMKSGIWVYDPSVGLYHRTSGSYDGVVSDNNLSVSDNTITTSANHNLKTGDSVVLNTTSGIGGVDTDTPLYVTVISDNELKLSLSRKAVKKQNYISLSGTPSASDVLVYAQNTDFGLSDTTSGAIASTTYSETPHPNMTSEIIWGSRFSEVDGTTAYGLFSFADSFNIGSFTTQRVYGENIEQAWKEVYNFIDGLQVDTESVVVKVQTEFLPDSKQLEGVWLDENTLNSSNPEDKTAWQDIEDGYELVIIDGYGRGRTAHVVSKSETSSVVTLKLDENIGTVNQNCTVYFTTFKKAGQGITVDNKIKEKVKSSLDSSYSPWCSLKIELRGYSPAVNMMELSNIVHKSGG